METAISYFNILPSNKIEINNFVQQVKETALDGNIDLLKFAVQLRAVEETINLLRTDKDISSAICEEAEKYPEARKQERLIYSGAKLSIKMTGVKYEYDDVRLTELEERMNFFKKKIKDREIFLKTIKDPIADAKTGEMLKPPVKSGTEKVIVTLMK